VSDQNLAGTVTPNQAVSGTVSNPDSFGAVTIDLNMGFAFAPVQFIGYQVDATHMKLIESDNASGGGFGSTGGIAIGQGAGTGKFKTAAAFSGNYVFGILGEDLSVNIPSTLTSVGLFTADGSGHLTNGFTDTFLQGSCVQASCTQNGIAGAQISVATSGTYAVAVGGTGRVRAIFNSFSPHPVPAIRPLLFFYLTGNGNPALVLDGGDSIVNPQTGSANYPSVGAGIAYARSSAPLTFSGTYGFGLTQQNGSETDATGQMTADSAASTLSGFMDTSTGSFDSPLTGSFAALSPNGRFAGNFSGQAFQFTSPVTSSLATEFYAIDPGHGFFVETDLTDPVNPSGVVSFGYYAVRTPVCAGCP
jgi:hypothetical protein